jgi:hypothetical protein
MDNARTLIEARLLYGPGEQCVTVPVGSDVLSVSAGNSIRVLFSSPVTERLTRRWFAVRTSDSSFPKSEEGRHVGTVEAGRALWAVFDITFSVLARPPACPEH